MNIRVMSLAEVVGAMQTAVNEFKGPRNLQVFVRNAYVDDGLPEDPHFGPIKWIGVEEVNENGTVEMCAGIVRLLPDGNLSFSDTDDNVGMLFFNKEGKQTSHQFDGDSLLIGDRFITIIGRQYFWERR